MNKSAILDEHGIYRYRLERMWDDDCPTLGWIMLNPSTADALENDPTIRRCIGFAKRRGYGRIIVANLFAFRATNPKKLLDPYIDDVRYDPFGPKNLSFIKMMFLASETIVAAWGSQPKIERREKTIFDLVHHELKALRPASRVVCLGTTINGYPRHPLYVKGSKPFEQYHG